jgi:hypothetical protein
MVTMFYNFSEDHGRLKPHLLRTPEYCWCDKDAIAQFALVGI